MKEFFIRDLKPEQEIQDFFLVKSIGLKVGSNQKQYLDVVVGDATGEINAKKWSVSDSELPSLEEISDGDFVKIKAAVTEWNGTKQLRVLRIRKANGQDDIHQPDYIKAAPEKSSDMLDYIMAAVEAMLDEDLKKLCLRLLKDNQEKLMYYPAAAKNHHAEYGGLLYHMKRMLDMGERACLVYTNLKRDWIVAGVIIHDMEKINEIDANETGVASGYSFEGQLLGHLIQGIKSIDRVARELEISEEKAILLEHMILSHHYEPEYGSPKRPLFPEAEMLHYLDIIDARMYDMQDALAGVEPGGFSDRVWTLENRKLYRPTQEVW